MGNNSIDCDGRHCLRAGADDSVVHQVIRINENEAGDKQQQFFQRTRDGKQILRDVMKRYIPEAVTRAEKQGFSAPDASWFKGDSMDFVQRKLLNGKARIYEVLDRQPVERLVREHMSGTENRRLLIWSLLNVEPWLEESGCALAG